MTAARRRIVLVDPSLAMTGALRAAVNLARAAKPWADTVLVQPRRTSVDPAELLDFAEVVRVPMRQIRRSAADLALFAPTLVSAGVTIRRLLRPDSVLVLNDFYLLHGGVVRALGSRAPIVTWVRTDPTSFPSALQSLWLGTMTRASDAIVSVSDFITARLDARGIASRRIYDPIDPARVAAVPGTAPGRDIVQIANYTRGKGQDDAIAAFSAIAARFPGARLRFHGGDMGLERNRQYLAALRRQAEASGFGDRIILDGFAQDVGSALAQSAFALVLSRRESFSLTCLEASQNGRAVIAYRSGGPQEIVSDGETGMLCEVGDIPAVASAMELLLAEPDRAEEMGARGAAHVRAKFAPEVFAEQVRTLLSA